MELKKFRLRSLFEKMPDNMLKRVIGGYGGSKTYCDNGPPNYDCTFSTCSKASDCKDYHPKAGCSCTL